MVQHISIADDEAMKVEITYTFNASELGGKNLVTFEELYDLSNPEEPVKVAEHKDIEDDGQTVLITERIIKIHTTATDTDGNKELEAGKEVTIIDTITLEGLEVGTQTLEFFGIDKDDENNQKRLRDLENGQCLLQDLYGRVGVVQIHPVFEELLHAFDTRPPVQRNEVE